MKPRKMSQAAIALLIFAACVWVYHVSGSLNLGSNDNIPHTLLALNWLENQTLNFDNFRDSYFFQFGETPYYFSEAPNGHLTSTYPIGTAIVTFPLYLLFFLYLKLSSLVQGLFSGDLSLAINLTSAEFEPTRRTLARLAATLCSALTVVLFYLSARLKFLPSVVLLTTFTFAFATSTWVLGSQDLRQHTVSNLLLTALIFCLLKANRTTGRPRQLLFLVAGCFCGLFPSVRLTSAIFVVTALVYVVYFYRREVIFFLLGLPTILLNWAWNSYYFGIENFSRGGYLRQFESGASGYNFSPDYIVEAFFGQLISPSDGFFVFAPVLLFALPGAYLAVRQRAGKDEILVLGLSLACLILFLHYCVYVPWDGGGGSYGPRFLMDVLPVVCLLVGYSLQAIVLKFSTASRPDRVLLALFLGLLLCSTAVEVIGAFSDTAWSKVPLPLIRAPERRWSLSDSQIERHFRNMVARIHPPISDPETYARQIDGVIEQIEWLRQNGTVVPLADHMQIRTGNNRILRATLRNTGQSPWFGYQTGLEGFGETRLELRLWNEAGRPVKLKQDRLYISGTPQPGETATAMALLQLPRQPGTYQAELRLIIEGNANEYMNPDRPPLHRWTITVLPRLKKNAAQES